MREVTHDGVRLWLEQSTEALSPFVVGLAAATMLGIGVVVVSWWVPWFACVSPVALVLGPLIGWMAGGRIAKGTEVEVGGARLRLVTHTHRGSRETVVPLATVVSVEVRDGHLRIFTADGGLQLVDLRGQPRARVLALEGLIEATRERLNARVGAERDVPEALRGLGPRG